MKGQKYFFLGFALLAILFGIFSISHNNNQNYATRSIASKESCSQVLKKIFSNIFSQNNLKAALGQNDYQKVLNKDVKQGSPLHKKILKLLKREIFTISPTIIIPLSTIVFDGGLLTAVLAGLKFSAAIKILDISLDAILVESKKFFSNKSQAFIVAASSNLPEAGVTFFPAIAGLIHFSHIAAVPLGSNPMNLALAGVALFTSLKNIAIKKGFLKVGERLNPKALGLTLKSIEWSSMRSFLGYAGYFASNALAFKYAVEPQILSGNYYPLIAWLTINIPSVTYYFTKDILKSKKVYKEIASKINLKQSLDNFELELNTLKGSENSFEKPSDEFQKIVEQLKNTDQNKPRNIPFMKKTIKQINNILKSDKNFKKVFVESLEKLDSEEFTQLLILSGVNLNKSMTSNEKIKSVFKLIIGISSVIIASALLDDGVHNLTQAYPDMGRSNAGFFILSFFSSLPELMGTHKFFSGINFKSGMQNISDSNALNMVIAHTGMMMAFLRFNANESLASEEDSESETQ